MASRNEPVKKIFCDGLHDTIKADEKTPKAGDESDKNCYHPN